MRVKKLYLFYYLFLLLIYGIKKAFTTIFEYNVRNTTEDINEVFRNMMDTKLSRYDVILNFDDEYYKLFFYNDHNIHMKNDIIFQSKKGAIWDYTNRALSVFFVNFGQKDLDKKMIFRNITFYNYNNLNNRYANPFVFETLDPDNRLTIEYDNCVFDKMIGITFNFQIACRNNVQTTPQVIFRNTKFMYAHIYIYKLFYSE